MPIKKEELIYAVVYLVLAIISYQFNLGVVAIVMNSIVSLVWSFIYCVDCVIEWEAKNLNNYERKEEE